MGMVILFIPFSWGVSQAELVWGTTFRVIGGSNAATRVASREALRELGLWERAPPSSGSHHRSPALTRHPSPY